MKRQLVLKLFAIKGIITSPCVYFAGYRASHLYCLLFTLFHGIHYVRGYGSVIAGDDGWVVVFSGQEDGKNDHYIWLAQKPVYEEEVLECH